MLTKKQIQRKIIQILRKHDVVKASLFGSYASNNADEESDIDLLVELGSGKSLLDLVGLNLELEELLKKKVDVITYRSLHPLLRDIILCEQEIFYEKESIHLS